MPSATPHTDFDDKPEMYAGPIDYTKGAPVKPKSELPAKSTISRKPVPEAHGTPRSELNAQSSSNAPWTHTVGGYMPPELHSTHLQEAGTGTLRNGMPASGARTGNQTSDATTVVGSATSGEDIIAPVESPSFNDAELAEDADAAVQELGLISVRKRALINSAKTAGVGPEAVQGRKGEEYRELIEREVRVRARLDEIEKLRSGG